eukprot:SAG31_NODE_4_length_45662_cov_15.654622_7_plen_144_part_00
MANVCFYSADSERHFPYISEPPFVAQFGSYTLTEYFTAYYRGVSDSWNALPAAVVAGAGVGVSASCAPSAVGAALGIMGLKFAVHGSGAELVHKTPAMNFYYGKGEAGRGEYAAANKSDWLKAPYKAPSTGGGDDDDDDDDDE